LLIGKRMAAAAPTVESIFQTKYDEFADELLAVFPELTGKIREAVALDEATRLARWQAEVKVTGEAAGTSANPGAIMPGIILADEVWTGLTDTTRSAIWEFLRILSMCAFLETGVGSAAADGGPSREWMEAAVNDMKESLGSIDFAKIMGKFSSLFEVGGGSGGSAADASGSSSPFPKLPERFLKGQIAKLAEEIIRDIKPEDLGLTAETIAQCEASPSRAFDIMIQVFTKNPAIIQSTIQRIGKRLQQKVQNGSIRPQELAREAEELMKEFSGNPEFADMLGGLKGMFGGGDDDEDFKMPAAGGDGGARLSAVRERLRKKVAAKAAGGAGIDTKAASTAKGGKKSK
jgi:hypothetical protein